MNHQIRLAVGSDILGDGCLQERFSAYVEILGQFVRHAPRPVDVARVVEMTNMPVAAVTRYLRELGGAGILKKLRGARGSWRLAEDPCDVTLEDVFRCAVATCTKRRRGITSPAVLAGGHGIELLLLQALQTVDDYLYKSLRTYSLDRLIASGAAPFPVRHTHSCLAFSETDE